MKKCCVCGKEFNKIFPQSCISGNICPDCADYIPSVVSLQNIGSGEAAVLKSRVKEIIENKSRIFCESTCYGDVHFDALNGLLVVGNVNKDGSLPDSNANIFDITNIEDLTFSAKAISSEKEKVMADIYLSFTLASPHIDVNGILVKKADICFADKEENGEIYFKIPYACQLFWDQLIEADRRIRKKYSDLAESSLITKEQVEYFKAKVLFMLEDDFTKEELDLSRIALLMAFKKNSKTEIIEKYYNLLLEYI